MIRNYPLLCLFGILILGFLTDTDAREAIINGRLVKPNQVSYQVSIQIQDYGHVCGGGIIDKYFVLTSAQCILDNTLNLRSSRIFVIAGTLSLNETDSPAVTRRVDKVYFPSEYDPKSAFNPGNIAVLRLESLVESLQLEQQEPPAVNLRKLELPHHQAKLPSTTELPLIAGFGVHSGPIIRHYKMMKGREWGFEADGRLRQAFVHIVSNHKCEKLFSETFETDKYLCGHGQNASVWDGDLGGPLVQDTTVIGILSGYRYQSMELAVYTRVEYYSMMIRNVVKCGGDRQMTSRHSANFLRTHKRHGSSCNPN